MMLGRIGKQAIKSFDYVTDLTCFITNTLAFWQPHRNVTNRAVYHMLLLQLLFTGVDAMAMITLLAILVGMGVTSQLIYIMQATAGAGDIIAILARLVLSEMGPLITGFILVGRSCSAIVVDLGNTKVGGEIEPLEYSGINLLDYLVVPRVLAMMISQVTLALYFTAVMIIFGVFFSAFLYDFSAQKSLTELLGAITVSGVLRFVVKNLFFGLIIGMIACYHGLMVKNLPTQVPEQMQSAVIRCLLFLFLADGYFILFTL